MKLLQKEKSIEQAFLRKMKKRFPDLRILKLSAISQRSWPDRMIPLPNRKIVFIEFKREGGKSTELQADCHEYLRELGHYVLVTSSSDEAIEFVEGFMR